MQALRVGPLVRAVSPTSAVIWAETWVPGIVTIEAQAQINENERARTEISHTITTNAPTITVGGRFFVVLRLQELQPATWYTYTLSLTSIAQLPVNTADITMLQCFRTFAANGVDKDNQSELRIGYGSCRKSLMPETDVLNALGSWLTDHYEQRDQMWPHLLLLIGDQIYADDPGDELSQLYPQLRDRAKTFVDFSLMYEYAWTHESGVRQALAVLPTYMIFDDHEVTNNWNTDPLWRIKSLEAGMEQLLVDGLVAYWVYQGWGNLTQHDPATMLLLSIMDAAARNDEDALEALRAAIRADIYLQTPLSWHYEIATTPPIFVANVRTERTTILNDKDKKIYDPMRIMSSSQMDTLLQWIRQQQTPATLVVSSVPLLLPPVIGLAEYVMGSRFWQHQHSQGPLRRLGRRLAEIQQRIASRNSFDHWPLYNESWKALMDAVTSTTSSEQTKDLIVLSGDVHFSYAMEGRRPFTSAASARIYQLVSTPIQNMLDASEQRKIRYQGYVSQLFYGRLRTRILSMRAVQKRTKNIQANQLFQNTLAMVTLQVCGDDYTIRHDYFGMSGTQLEVIAHTSIKDRHWHY